MKRVPYESLDYVQYRMCLDSEPFTGVAYLLDNEGRLEAEVTYQDGIEKGLKRDWFETGELSEEAFAFRGVLHGRKRVWHPNGKLAEESDYEIGIKLREKRWDEDGNLIEEFELDKDDPDYKRLVEVYRPGYPGAPPIENPID